MKNRYTRFTTNDVAPRPKAADPLTVETEPWRESFLWLIACSIIVFLIVASEAIYFVLDLFGVAG